MIAKLHCVKNVMTKKTTFSAKIATVFTLIISLFSRICDANYAEIGFNDGLEVNSLIRVDSVFYLQASKGEDFESIGVGLGYRIKSLNLVATFNVENDERAAEFHAMYYDRGMPVFLSIKQNIDTNQFSAKIGTGYPINEKVSLITHISERGLFVGVRRIL